PPSAVNGLILSATKPRIFAYDLPDGWKVLAGATDADNDFLSTELAEPDDWWFHTDGVPGSHVILRAKTGAEPSRETLRQAAAVAAYHSKARNAGLVPVHCTKARFVKKPRGVKTGTVQVAKGTVLKVRPDISFATRTRGESGALPNDKQ
ncbi:MAG TPA: NFACT RNA binding domain-containing protein, partial [Candidatus Binatus sp.]|nr:NFACT RNA binding domain-containing protein [Candidatus Binatus sp.]